MASYRRLSEYFGRINGYFQWLFQFRSSSASSPEETSAEEESLYSTSTLGPLSNVVNPNMKLIVQPGTAQPRKKLAIIMEWMRAKGKYVQRYHSLYLQEGFDVLSVHLSPLQMLFPSMGTQEVAREVLNFLRQNTAYEDVVVHAFSVGAYLFGEAMVIMKHEEEYGALASRIRGLVLDSPADIQNIPRGFPRAVASNPVLVKCLEMYTATHLWLMHYLATRHYMKASETFHDTFLSCPSLFLISRNDTVGGPLSVDVVAEKWRRKGLDLTLKVWDKSQHVSHLHFHEDEYKREIKEFLRKINLSQ